MAPAQAPPARPRTPLQNLFSSIGDGLNNLLLRRGLTNTRLHPRIVGGRHLSPEEDAELSTQLRKQGQLQGAANGVVDIVNDLSVVGQVANDPTKLITPRRLVQFDRPFGPSLDFEVNLGQLQGEGTVLLATFVSAPGAAPIRAGAQFSARATALSSTRPLSVIDEFAGLARARRAPDIRQADGSSFFSIAGPGPRGRAIEDAIVAQRQAAGDVSVVQTPPPFRAVDITDATRLTSVKSKDLTLPSFQKPNALRNALRSDIRALHRFDGDEIGNAFVRSSDNRQRVLQLVIQRGRASQAHIDEIASARQFAAERNILLEVTEIP